MGWITAGFCLVVLVLSALCTLPVMGRFAALNRRVERLSDSSVLITLPMLGDEVERIGRALPLIQQQLARANSAVRSIQSSARALWIPQAIGALRIAGSAVKLLLANAH